MEQRENNEAAGLTSEEKHRQLYDRQAELLKTFLQHGAISQEQYNKSFGDLTAKMGYKTHR